MKKLLKFITCGSVDDGKSTLIGNILYNAKLIFADQENALVMDSKMRGKNADIDYSLLLDGLTAEREQGITIDVAYRYFSTGKRSFIVADTPGHEEYTQNMAVGASGSDLAVILIDVNKGVITQTRRHIRICSLMGIRHFVFTINKMDTVSYDENSFTQIIKDIEYIMKAMAYDNIYFIPVSATKGDNILTMSSNTEWYKGVPLLHYLENMEISNNNDNSSFVMPVQRVNRPNKDFRGFEGQVVQGELSIGDTVQILPDNKSATIKELFFIDKKVKTIFKEQPVTIVFNEEIDCSRGDVIVKGDAPNVSRLIRCNMLWMDEDDLVVGRNYLIKIGTKTLLAQIMKIHYCVDVNTGEEILRSKAHKNDLINCDISLSEKVVVDSFEKTMQLGRFILINRISNLTSACGVVSHTLYRSDNLTWQNLDISKKIRAQQKNQSPKTIWFTGLSGSGKSTIANSLEKKLVSLGKHTMILDGDNVRMGLNNDLGFSEQDRIENIRRFAECAKLMNDAGLIVLVSVISPFESERENARKIIGDDYFEIYVNTSLDECERRDVKGLYRKARQGEIANFTGISSPYEEPTNPDFIANTEVHLVEEIIDNILEMLNIQ